MNAFASTMAAACLFALAACAGGAEDPPSPAQLLAAVVERLPREPLRIRGDILVRRRHGVPVATLRFDMRLNWGADPATAGYTLRDAFGATLERLTVTRPSDGAVRFAHAAGDPPVEGPLPDLDAPVRGTDFSWMDLTLSFLWWDAVAISGAETVRGRDCYVLDVRPPEGARAGRVRRTRLWIDRELSLLLQAEALDGDGRPLRRLWVKSIKKLNDRWMIKDMEVQGYPEEHRTRVQVLEVDEGPAP